jgi:hypothetical protein
MAIMCAQVMEETRQQRMSAEILDRLYFCVNCKSVFLFQADLTDHQEMYGHEKYSEVPFK